MGGEGRGRGGGHGRSGVEGDTGGAGWGCQGRLAHPECPALAPGQRLPHTQGASSSGREVAGLYPVAGAYRGAGPTHRPHDAQAMSIPKPTRHLGLQCSDRRPKLMPTLPQETWPGPSLIDPLLQRPPESTPQTLCHHSDPRPFPPSLRSPSPAPPASSSPPLRLSRASSAPFAPAPPPLPALPARLRPLFAPPPPARSPRRLRPCPHPPLRRSHAGPAPAPLRVPHRLRPPARPAPGTSCAGSARPYG